MAALPSDPFSNLASGLLTGLQFGSQFAVRQAQIQAAQQQAALEAQRQALRTRVAETMQRAQQLGDPELALAAAMALASYEGNAAALRSLLEMAQQQQQLKLANLGRQLAAAAVGRDARLVAYAATAALRHLFPGSDPVVVPGRDGVRVVLDTGERRTEKTFSWDDVAAMGAVLATDPGKIPDAVTSFLTLPLLRRKMEVEIAEINARTEAARAQALSHLTEAKRTAQQTLLDWLKFQQEQETAIFDRASTLSEAQRKRTDEAQAAIKEIFSDLPYGTDPTIDDARILAFKLAARATHLPASEVVGLVAQLTRQPDTPLAEQIRIEAVKGPQGDIAYYLTVPRGPNAEPVRLPLDQMDYATLTTRFGLRANPMAVETQHPDLPSSAPAPGQPSIRAVEQAAQKDAQHPPKDAPAVQKPAARDPKDAVLDAFPTEAGPVPQPEASIFDAKRPTPLETLKSLLPAPREPEPGEGVSFEGLPPSASPSDAAIQRERLQQWWEALKRLVPAPRELEPGESVPFEGLPPSAMPADPASQVARSLWLEALKERLAQLLVQPTRHSPDDGLSAHFPLGAPPALPPLGPPAQLPPRMLDHGLSQFPLGVPPALPPLGPPVQFEGRPTSESVPFEGIAPEPATRRVGKPDLSLYDVPLGLPPALPPLGPPVQFEGRPTSESVPFEGIAPEPATQRAGKPDLSLYDVPLGLPPALPPLGPPLQFDRHSMLQEAFPSEAGSTPPSGVSVSTIPRPVWGSASRKGKVVRTENGQFWFISNDGKRTLIDMTTARKLVASGVPYENRGPLTPNLQHKPLKKTKNKTAQRKIVLTKDGYFYVDEKNNYLPISPRTARRFIINGLPFEDLVSPPST